MPSPTDPEIPTVRLLFVCMGNICRSPAAENLFRHHAGRSGLTGTTCDSAGTIDLHRGKRPDARMRRAARRRGVELTGTARPVERRDFDRFDLIIVMDDENAVDVRALARDGRDERKVRMFCEFCRHHGDREVPDPYYGGDDGFEYVLDLLEDGSSTLVDQVRSGTLLQPTPKTSP